MRLFLLTLLVFSPILISAQEDGQDINALHNALLPFVQKANIPGYALVEINEAQPRDSHVYGVLSKATGDPVNESSVFEAASLTKPVVAYCALKLVERKRLDPDKPLYEYYPYPDLAHDERYKLITARMVLSHTSGLPNWRENRESDSVQLRFDPGDHFGYSGEGFVFLQKAMEEITQLDLDSIARKYVFGPLEMSQSSLVFNYRENYATGHDKNGKVQEKNKPDQPNAAYSLHTTAGDYARFLMELDEPEQIDRDLIREMFTLQKNAITEDESVGWGLGVGLHFHGDDKYIWHWGDNRYFKSFFIFFPRNGKGFAYFSNGENGLSIVRRLIAEVFGDEGILESWDDYEQL